MIHSTSAPKMNIKTVFSRIKKKAETAAPINGTIKFILNDMHLVFIDGTGNSNVVTQDNKQADCTMSTTIDVLDQLNSGDVNPITAFMGGKIKIQGSMFLAMKSQAILD